MEPENQITNGLDKGKNGLDNTVVTPKTIDVFSDFAVTLKEIHVRLIAEGYIVKDGVLTKSERLLNYEQDNKPPRKNR